MIKTKYLIIVVAVVAGAVLVGTPGSADEAASMWGRIYSRSEGIAQKNQIMRSMIELDNQGLIPVFMDALAELVEQRLTFGRREAGVRQSMMLLCVQELGDLRASEAAQLIYRVVRETENINLKREALISLGKTGVRSYAAPIATILKNLNLGREGKNALDEEKIAFGCITALEMFKDAGGYEPVFFSITAGYSRMIQNLATRALPVILEDPTDMLIGIMQRDADPRVKTLALEQAEASGAPLEKKAKVAIEALHQGLTVVATNIPDKNVFTAMRKKTLLILRDRQAAKDETVVSDVDQVLYLETDLEERLYAIDLLGAIATDFAAESLSRLLAYYNNRRSDGITMRDERPLKATIAALGRTKSKIGLEELMRAQYVGFSSAVEGQAAKVLESLNKD